MGSGVNSSSQGKYVGNGGSAAIEIKPGFKPKTIKIMSVNGQAKFIAHMPKAMKIANGGANALIDGLEAKEFGFEVTGSETVLNANGVEYYYECY